jgi:hypothetical protein
VSVSFVLLLTVSRKKVKSPARLKPETAISSPVPAISYLLSPPVVSICNDKLPLLKLTPVAVIAGFVRASDPTPSVVAVNEPVTLSAVTTPPRFTGTLLNFRLTTAPDLVNSKSP